MSSDPYCAQVMHIGLFITGLVDLLRLSVGIATIKFLEEAGGDVAVPETQICVGQPGIRSEDSATGVFPRLTKCMAAGSAPLRQIVGPMPRAVTSLAVSPRNAHIQ